LLHDCGLKNIPEIMLLLAFLQRIELEQGIRGAKWTYKTVFQQV
jgi:hypothetical protein